MEKPELLPPRPPPLSLNQLAEQETGITVLIGLEIQFLPFKVCTTWETSKKPGRSLIGTKGCIGESKFPISKFYMACTEKKKFLKKSSATYRDIKIQSRSESVMRPHRNYSLMFTGKY